MFKIIALLLNSGWVIYFSFLLVDEGFSSDYLGVYLLMFSSLILNLFVIIFGNGNNWLSLYFKRKAIEEKKKIAEIEKSIK